MKERPLLFKGEMVRAILEDRKTQTRRLRSLDIINENPDDFELKGLFLEKPKKNLVTIAQFTKLSAGELVNIACPYGKPGDLFWVRETWREALSENHECYAYRANMVYRCGKRIPLGAQNISPWKPSIHMKKAIARIWLECTALLLTFIFSRISLNIMKFFVTSTAQCYQILKILVFISSIFISAVVNLQPTFGVA